MLPIKTAKDGQKVYQGTYADFKWLGKSYESEVLKVSGNALCRCVSCFLILLKILLDDRQLLLKLCDTLVKMECTRDVLEEVEIDSTTDRQHN